MQTQTVETLEQELEDAKTRIAELEQENRDLLDDKDDLDDKIKELKEEVGDYENQFEGKTTFPNETMYDEMKRDYLLEIWEHYTPQEIEAALPRR